MAKIPGYTQNKLASSLVGVAPVDLSGGDTMRAIAGDANQVSSAALAYGAQQIQQDRIATAKKEAEIKALEAKQQNTFDEIEAYQVSVDTEAKLWQMIDQTKIDYAHSPADGLKHIQDEGNDLIINTLNAIPSNGVKEKAAGIIMNSYRGKLSEFHTWSRAQSTANAQTQLGGAMDTLAQQAGRSTDFGQIQQLLTKADSAKGNMELAFGAKAPDIINKSKTNIAKSYIMGMLDRGQPQQVAATLDSGAFDSMIDTNSRVTLKKAAGAMIKAQDEVNNFDKTLQVVGIKQRIAIAKADGSYTPSMGVEAKAKLVELQGTKSDFSTIISADIDYINGIKKKVAEKEKRDTLGHLYEEYYKLTGGGDDIDGKKNGKTKLNPNVELEDVVKFQNEVEKAQSKLSPQEYEKFMAKLTKSKTDRLNKMGRGMFGLPQCELNNKDEFSGGYKYMYDWSKKHITDNDKRVEILDYMTSTFIKAVDQVEKNNKGKPLTSEQKWRVIKEIQHRAAKKINPHLSNLPATGQRMADANGNQIIAYPDGSIERLS